MKQLNVRFTDDLHAALKACAEHDRRSLNSEILTMLEQAVSEHVAHPPAGQRG